MDKTQANIDQIVILLNKGGLSIYQIAMMRCVNHNFVSKIKKDLIRSRNEAAVSKEYSNDLL